MHMARLLHFISHPNVLIDPAVPVPCWPLSETGKARMTTGLSQPWVAGVTSVYCSTERKAIDSAAILASHLGIGFTQWHTLGENDRSATGFLHPPEFEATADAFFAHPEQSVRGWERAADAQARIVDAVLSIGRQERSGGSIAIVSHGAVGTLLYCHLTGQPISRTWDQPPNGGGNFYTFTLAPPLAFAIWAPVDGTKLLRQSP
jgi:broad specificity phosphatase PhoE